MKKKTKIALIISSVLVAALFITLMVWYFGASYKEFYAIAKKEFFIPGLDTKYAPQGLCYNEENQIFIVGGYMTNGEPSRFYVVKNGSEKAEKYFTLKEGDKAYTGHAGGITIHNSIAFVVGDGKVYCFNLQDVLDAENKGAVEIRGSFETGNGADFVLTYEDKLIVGEFYHKKAYKTDPSHHIETSDKTINKALSFVYTINESKDIGVDETAPIYGISMPELVQGMTFTKEGNIVLSTSYSLADSHLYVYKNVLSEEPTKKVMLNSSELPVYVLEESNKIETHTLPCMSEEVALANGRVYVLFESNAAKYRAFTRVRMKNVYSLDI